MQVYDFIIKGTVKTGESVVLSMNSFNDQTPCIPTHVTILLAADNIQLINTQFYTGNARNTVLFQKNVFVAPRATVNFRWPMDQPYLVGLSLSQSLITIVNTTVDAGVSGTYVQYFARLWAMNTQDGTGKTVKVVNSNPTIDWPPME